MSLFRQRDDEQKQKPERSEPNEWWWRCNRWAHSTRVTKANRPNNRKRNERSDKQFSNHVVRFWLFMHGHVMAHLKYLKVFAALFRLFSTFIRIRNVLTTAIIGLYVKHSSLCPTACILLVGYWAQPYFRSSYIYSPAGSPFNTPHGRYFFAMNTLHPATGKREP